MSKEKKSTIEARLHSNYSIEHEREPQTETCTDVAWEGKPAQAGAAYFGGIRTKNKGNPFGSPNRNCEKLVKVSAFLSRWAIFLTADGADFRRYRMRFEGLAFSLFFKSAFICAICG